MVLHVRLARWLSSFAVVLAACSGPSADVRGVTKGPSEVERAAGEDLRRAQMSAGTNWMPGELASFCDGGRCTTDPSVRPARFLRAPDDGLLVFVVSRRPTQAALAVTKASGKVVMERELSPGTAMAFEAALPPGRYVAELTAVWDGRNARWVFGVRV